MANLAITNTFTALATISSSQVNQDLTDIKTWLNNRDNATDNWLNVKGGTITATTQLIGKGTTTNDNATALYIGEYLESLVSSAASVGTTNQFFDATSLSITAGDWDVTGLINYIGNGATFPASQDFEIGISTTTGNSSTGLTQGVNYLKFLTGTVLGANAQFNLAIPAFRVSLSSTTTYYLKGFCAAYTVGTPQYVCRLSSRRVR